MLKNINTLVKRAKQYQVARIVKKSDTTSLSAAVKNSTVWLGVDFWEKQKEVAANLRKNAMLPIIDERIEKEEQFLFANAYSDQCGMKNKAMRAVLEDRWKVLEELMGYGADDMQGEVIFAPFSNKSVVYEKHANLITFAVSMGKMEMAENLKKSGKITFDTEDKDALRYVSDINGLKMLVECGASVQQNTIDRLKKNADKHCSALEFLYGARREQVRA